MRTAAVAAAAPDTFELVFAHLDMATQYKDKVEVGMAADSYKLALLSAPF